MSKLILCVGSPPEILERLRDDLRIRFEGSHRVDVIEDRAAAAALIKVLQAGWVQGRLQDEVEVLVGAGSPGPEAELLAGRYPMSQWVVVSEAPEGEAAWPRAARTVAWPDEYGELLEAVAEATELYRRRKRDTLVEELKRVKILRDLPEDQIEWLVERNELRHYEGRQVVFEAGELGDGTYVILGGEVEVLGVDPITGEELVVAKLGRGEHFGEMSLLTGAPRSNTVVAAVDSELLFVSKEHCDELLAAQPSLGLRLSQVLSARLRKTQRRTRRAPRLIACRAGAGDAPGWIVARGFAEAIAADSDREVAILDLNGAHAALGNEHLDDLLREPTGQESVSRQHCAGIAPGVFCLAARDARDLSEHLEPQRVSRLLEALAHGFDFVVVSLGAWVSEEVLIRILRRCDTFLVDLGTEAESVLRVAADIESLRRGSPSAEGKIALVVEASLEPRAAWWEAVRALNQPVVYRIAAGARSSAGAGGFRRAARQLLGIGVGVALGGGGGRSAAHIGVLDVLEREGISVDYISGTSAGSIIAAAYAIGKPVSELMELWEQETVKTNPVKQYTLSRTSLFSSRRLEDMFRRAYGDSQIEDLPLSFFAVSADLLSAGEVAIESGSVWKAVRASCSVPGILAPVSLRDLYLVDGAVANNVPGDLLKKKGARLVIAVNITPKTSFRLEDLEGRPPRGLRKLPVLRNLLSGPSALQIIMRAWEIEALETVRHRSWAFDVHIHPPVDEFPTLAFDQWREILERGRQAATAHLPEIRTQLGSILEDL